MEAPSCFSYGPIMASLEELLDLQSQLHVVDIGAAAIDEAPRYKPLLERGIARLTAVDGDDRQQEAMREAFGPDARLVARVLGDGLPHTLHVAHEASGMTSLLKPSPQMLEFFNGFPVIGTVLDQVEVRTERMADLPELQEIDFLTMDVQGAELMILEHSGGALDSCVAIQTEASFIPLYENQPSFADIDRWMRGRGFLPHCFAELKRWSIAPVLRDGDARNPFNQLLECDIVYIRSLVDLSALTLDQLRKMALIAAYCYASPDLALHAIGEIERRGFDGLGARVLELFVHGR